MSVLVLDVVLKTPYSTSAGFLSYCVDSDFGVAIGNLSRSNPGGVAIGNSNTAGATGSISIGTKSDSTVVSPNSIILGSKIAHVQVLLLILLSSVLFLQVLPFLLIVSEQVFLILSLNLSYLILSLIFEVLVLFVILVPLLTISKMHIYLVL